MIAAYEAAEAEGAGAISFRGKMIDRAMIRKARSVLAQAEPRNPGQAR